MALGASSAHRWLVAPFSARRSRDDCLGQTRDVAEHAVVKGAEEAVGPARPAEAGVNFELVPRAAFQTRAATGRIFAGS